MREEGKLRSKFDTETNNNVNNRTQHEINPGEFSEEDGMASIDIDTQNIDIKSKDTVVPSDQEDEVAHAIYQKRKPPPRARSSINTETHKLLKLKKDEL